MASLREITTINPFFRDVLETTSKQQLVAMTLQPGQDIGWEVHPQDQFVYIESGHGLASIDLQEYHLTPGFGVIIPSGILHNIVNTSEEDDLHLFVIYSPPKHPVDEIQVRKGN